MNQFKIKFEIFIFLLISTFAIQSCTDDCDSQLFYTYYEPQYLTTAEIRNSFEFRAPEELSIPGKIYMFDNHIFINEVGKGIHIVDNSDKRNPKKVGFVNIPGNFDMAVKGNILYADSYIDLIAIDISDLNNIHIVKRLEGVFDELYYYDFMEDDSGLESLVVGYNEIDTVWYDDPECDAVMPSFLRFEGGGIMLGGAMSDAAFQNSAVQPPSASASGIGGSMARFTIVNDLMYTVSIHNLKVFDITVISDPIAGNEVDIGWDIETIFPYNNNLFIGARNGMHIFDISEPTLPQFMSTYEHIRSCDPVVVNDTIAFVTLRSGTECEGFSNQLEVIDIKNLYNPQLLKIYPMSNPHGLGLDGDALFICEADYGLKVFNASEIYKIDQNLIKHYTDIHAFDVIPFNNTLMMIGEDGLYQFDYTSLEDIQYLSHLPIAKAK